MQKDQKGDIKDESDLKKASQHSDKLRGQKDRKVKIKEPLEKRNTLTINPDDRRRIEERLENLHVDIRVIFDQLKTVKDPDEKMEELLKKTEDLNNIMRQLRSSEVTKQGQVNLSGNKVTKSPVKNNLKLNANADLKLKKSNEEDGIIDLLNPNKGNNIISNVLDFNNSIDLNKEKENIPNDNSKITSPITSSNQLNQSLVNFQSSTDFNKSSSGFKNNTNSNFKTTQMNKTGFNPIKEENESVHEVNTGMQDSQELAKNATNKSLKSINPGNNNNNPYSTTVKSIANLNQSKTNQLSSTQTSLQTNPYSATIKSIAAKQMNLINQGNQENTNLVNNNNQNTISNKNLNNVNNSQAQVQAQVQDEYPKLIPSSIKQDQRFTSFDVQMPMKYYYDKVQQQAPNPTKDENWYLRPHHIESFNKSEKALPDDILNTKYISYYAPANVVKPKTKTEELDEIIDKIHEKREKLQFDLFRNMNKDPNLRQYTKKMDKLEEQFKKDYKPGMIVDKYGPPKIKKTDVDTMFDGGDQQSYSEMFNKDYNVYQKNLVIDSYKYLIEDMRDNERNIMNEKRKEEFNRIRPPVDKWWEVKDKQFINELQRNKMVLNAQPDYFIKLRELQDDDLY